MRSSMRKMKRGSAHNGAHTALGNGGKEEHHQSQTVCLCFASLKHLRVENNSIFVQDFVPHTQHAHTTFCVCIYFSEHTRTPREIVFSLPSSVQFFAHANCFTHANCIAQDVLLGADLMLALKRPSSLENAVRMLLLPRPNNLLIVLRHLSRASESEIAGSTHASRQKTGFHIIDCPVYCKGNISIIEASKYLNTRKYR